MQPRQARRQPTLARRRPTSSTSAPDSPGVEGRRSRPSIAVPTTSSSRRAVDEEVVDRAVERTSIHTQAAGGIALGVDIDDESG